MTDQNWHIKKEINIGHILTTLAAIITFFIWAQTLETRIAVLETQQMNTRSDMSRIEGYLVRIESKIDKKADKP